MTYWHAYFLRFLAPLSLDEKVYNRQMRLKSLLILTMLVFIPSLALPSPQPLPVNQAFQCCALVENNQTVEVRWKIAPGYYLYQDRIQITPLQPADLKLGTLLFPAAQAKTTADGASFKIFQDALIVGVPIIQTSSNVITLQINYQGCSKQEFCYPPVSQAVTVNLTENFMHPVAAANIEVAPTETNPIVMLLQKNFLTWVLGFLGLGILISFTPCVLPMIPILSGIVVGRGHSHGRAFLLSLAYVIGMALAYALLGIIFGLIGNSIQPYLQQTWILIFVSLLLALMALSLFGFYQFQLPEKWRAFFNNVSQKTPHSGLLGTAAMGGLSSLVLSPCATPPLVGVLGYISHTGDALLGAAALFTLGLGMGLPLLLIGLFGTRVLPKSGPWMNTIKNILGIALLAIAIFTLQRILPQYIIMLLWALLAAGTAIYLGALATATTVWQTSKKIFGLGLFAFSIFLVTESRHDFRHSKLSVEQTLFTPVHSLSQIQAFLTESKQNHGLVMLDFSASWCIACAEMDKFTFSDIALRQKLTKWVVLRADVTANNAQDKLIQHQFGVIAPPTLLFFKDGKEINNSRIIGKISADKLILHLSQLH